MLTMEQLLALEISEDAATRILAAHEEDSATARQAHEAAMTALEQQYNEALARQTQMEVQLTTAADALKILHQERRQDSICRELLSMGANPQAVKLLALDVHAAEEDFTPEDALRDAETLLSPLRTQYAAFFSQPVRLPTPPVSPPTSASPPLTRADVRRMSKEDINRNWSAVRSALLKGDA